MKSVTVTLWLRVENNSKFARGKARARRDIEAHLERYYAMKRLGDWTYQPTVEYDDTGAEG